MSVLGGLVRALARWLPEEERGDLAVALSMRASSAGGAGELADGPDRDEEAAIPEWPREWKALLAAGEHAGRVVQLLEDERAYFDYSTLADAAGELRERLDEAYGLLCAAPRLEGLALERGDDLETVRRAIDLRRGEIVEADLAPAQPVPADGTATWALDYDTRGGFVAVSNREADGTEPWKFWGMASTADSAAHVLSWFFAHRPPEIRVRAPEPPRPWVRIGWESDRSEEGPGVPELLALRGPVYEEHLAACREARRVLREHAGDVAGYLAARAAVLEERDPQLRGHAGLRPISTQRNRDHVGSAHTVAWVPSRLVVGTVHGTWGEFGEHRPETPLDIAEGLLDTVDLDAFTDRLFCPDISLLYVPAWAGPLYRLGSNGSHRIHTARMLELPWLAATVQVEGTAPLWDLLGLVAADRVTGDEHAGSFERRVDERIRVVEGLLRRGVIDGDLCVEGMQSVLRCTRLPAVWLLRDPGYAVRVNRMYESRYPGALAQLGIPSEIGIESSAWVRWLTER